MSDSFPIDEVVRRTGLTSRALRFYEARGLVSPLRTQSGRRWFGTDELERVHQIIALKKAGLSLGDIKRLFDCKPIRLGEILTAQHEKLTDQAKEIADALSLVDAALSRIGRGEPLDAATLCSLIRDGDKMMNSEAKAWNDLIDRYYTPEQQDEWRQHMPPETQFSSEEYLDKWRELSGRIKAALPLDPSSDAALAFVREWFALLEPFTNNATQSMWEGTARMYSDMDKWEGQVDPGFSKKVWDFINQAARVARESGKDIGPLPDFL